MIPNTVPCAVVFHAGTTKRTKPVAAWSTAGRALVVDESGLEAADVVAKEIARETGEEVHWWISSS